MDSIFSPKTAEFVRIRRIARLATVDRRAAPHAIPVCYAFDGERIYTAIDLKPKRVDGRRLQRVRNIQANPSVALVIDDYSEDWSELAYVTIRGKAEIIEGGEERQRAEELLRQKYRQYASMLEPGCAVIRLTPERVISWGAV